MTVEGIAILLARVQDGPSSEQLQAGQLDYPR